MAEVFDSRTISVYIDRPLREVYDFVSVPENVPTWASGLGTSIERVNDEWVAHTPHGPMKLRFTEPNRFGVLDHSVRPASGEEIYLPMRVVVHGRGTELLFTLFRQPGWSDEQFAQDAAWVERDLTALKTLLEATSH